MILIRFKWLQQKINRLIKNLNNISILDYSFITMSDGVKVEVSRRKLSDFLQKFKEFNQKRLVL